MAGTEEGENNIKSIIKNYKDLDKQMAKIRGGRSEPVVVTVQVAVSMMPFFVTLDRTAPTLSPEDNMINDIMKDAEEHPFPYTPRVRNIETETKGEVSVGPVGETKQSSSPSSPPSSSSQNKSPRPEKTLQCKAENVVTVKIAEDYTVLPLIVPLDKGGYLLSKEPSEDDKMIDKIMEDVEDLSKLRHGSNAAALENQPCSMSGSWISAAGGMEIIIPENQNSTTGVELRKTITPVNTNGFLMEGGWTLRMEAPFARTPAVLFVGYRKEGKKIATFIGECRFCNGIEAVTGSWLIARSALDCKDEKSSQALIGDVMRRNNVEKLKESHIEELVREGKTR